MKDGWETPGFPFVTSRLVYVDFLHSIQSLKNGSVTRERGAPDTERDKAMDKLLLSFSQDK